MGNAPTYREVLTLIMEGQHCTLQGSQIEMTEDNVVLPKRRGEVHIDL